MRWSPPDIHVCVYAGTTQRLLLMSRRAWKFELQTHHGLQDTVEKAPPVSGQASARHDMKQGAELLGPKLELTTDGEGIQLDACGTTGIDTENTLQCKISHNNGCFAMMMCTSLPDLDRRI